MTFIKMSKEENNPLEGPVGQYNVDSPMLQSNPCLIPWPVFMPETCTGMGRQWYDWAEQFDLAANVNNWEDSLKLKFISLLLSGHA